MAPILVNSKRCRYAGDERRIEDTGCRGLGMRARSSSPLPASCILHPFKWPCVSRERVLPMPIVNIDLAWLNRLLGKPYETEVLQESLEQIGCDVEDVVDIERSRCPNCNSLVEHPLGQEEVKVCT